MADDATDDDVQPQSHTTAGETKSRAPALEHVDLVAYEIYANLLEVQMRNDPGYGPCRATPASVLAYVSGMSDTQLVGAD